jgi:hypothetical protein
MIPNDFIMLLLLIDIKLKVFQIENYFAVTQILE